MKKANWIWLNEQKKDNVFAEFKDFFFVKNVSGKVFIDISVTGNYVIFINDKFVSCSQTEDFPERKIYDTVDISKFIIDGENAITILANNQCLDSANQIVMTSAVIFEIYTEKEILGFSSAETLSAESAVYLGGEQDKFGNGNYYCSALDLTKTTLIDNKSQVVTVDYKLVKRQIQLIKTGELVKSKLSAQGVFELEQSQEKLSGKLLRSMQGFIPIYELSGEYERPFFPNPDGITFKKDGKQLFFILDLQKTTNGYLALDFEVNGQCELYVAFGEHLDDMRVRSQMTTRNFTAKIKCKKGRNVFTDYLKRYGCRYIQFYFNCDEIKLYYLGLRYAYYPVKVLPYKANGLLRQKIYDVSVRTLTECMHEHYEDCPLREQSLYAMDGRNQMLSGYYAFGEYSFVKENITMLVQRLRKDGLIYLTAPTERELCIPAFSLALVESVKDYYLHTNDCQFVKEILPRLKIIIKAFTDKIEKNGLIARLTGDESVWNFYEWTENLSNGFGDNPLKDGSVEYPTILNALLCSALKSLLLLCQAVNENGEEYAMFANRIKKGIDENLWLKDEKAFAGYLTDGKLWHLNELANAMVLYAGAANKEKLDIIAKRLMQEDNGLLKVTLSMSIFKYDGLINHDKNNIPFVLNEIDKIWSEMLFNSATTFWETSVGADDFGYAGSLCHGWSAIPVYFYKKYDN